MKRIFRKLTALFVSICSFCVLIGGIPAASAADMIQQLLCTSYTVTPGGVAEITVSVNDNIGFCNLGLVMTYDSDLYPLCDEEGNPVYQIGEVTQNNYSATSNNPEKHLLTFAMAGNQNIYTNGKLFTVYFQIPTQAKIGTGYIIDLEAKLVSDKTGKSLLDKTETTGSRITVADEQGRTGLTDDQIVVECGIVEAHAGATAVIPIKIKQNPGFSSCGFRVTYNTALTPKLNFFGNPSCELGTVGKGLSTTVYLNKQEQMIGFQASSSSNRTGDGTIFTLPFVVPQNAVAGDSYTVAVQVDYLDDTNHSNLLSRVVVNAGEIVIPKENPSTEPFSPQGTTVTSTTTTTTTTVTTTTAPEADTYLRGDVNVDGKVAISDVVLLSRYVNEEPVTVTKQGKKNADVNNDSMLDTSDATMILKIIAKLI